MKTKWHYFKADDKLCFFDASMFAYYPRILYTTACSRDIKKVKRHTEFKSSVNCLICLRILNRLDRQKLKGSSNV